MMMAGSRGGLFLPAGFRLVARWRSGSTKLAAIRLGNKSAWLYKFEKEVYKNSLCL